MDTKIGGSRFTRSRQPDPASVWAPLGDLADAAQRASGHRGIVIARGFDRNSRQRAKALRDLLMARDIPAIEVTSAPDSERLLAGADIAVVVNLLASDSWQSYRLAAKLQVPMLTPKSSEDSSTAELRHDVIGMTGDSDTRDVAFSHVAVRPEDPSASSLVITSDGEPLSLPGGWITLVPGQQRLLVQVGAPDFAELSFEASRIRVETFDGPHRLVRDELPIAEFDGAVVFAAEPRGLVVQPV